MSGGIPMDPRCPRCAHPHGVEVSGDGDEWDCQKCGGHLICAIGPDGGEMYPYHRPDGSCGCTGEPHTCDDVVEHEAEVAITDQQIRDLHNTFVEGTATDAIARLTCRVALGECVIATGKIPMTHRYPTAEEIAEARARLAAHRETFTDEEPA